MLGTQARRRSQPRALQASISRLIAQASTATLDGLSGSDYWRRWIPLTYGLLAHLAACVVENRRDVARSTHTYVTIQRAADPGLRERIINVYRIHRDKDPRAYQESYQYPGQEPVLLDPEAPLHRLFITETEGGAFKGFHAVNIPIVAAGLLLLPPLDFYMRVQVREVELTRQAHQTH